MANLVSQNLLGYFFETITLGWFDKPLNRKSSPKTMENVVLIVPSKSSVDSLLRHTLKRNQVLKTGATRP